MIQRQRQVVSWLLVVALLNVLFVPALGGMHMAQKTVYNSAPSAHLLADGGCHGPAVASSSSEVAMVPVSQDICPDCKDSCSLCFQVSPAIPSRFFTALSMRYFFIDAAFHLMDLFNPDLLLPPPRSAAA
jgi:hypothetical protein